MIEVNDESLILVLAQHLVEEAMAGRAFLTEHALLAVTRVNQQTQRQREIGFLRKILDNLGPAIFLQLKIVFRQIPDELALFVMHGGEQVDYLHFAGEGGVFLRCIRLLLGPKPRRYRRAECRAKEAAPRNHASINKHGFFRKMRCLILWLQ